MSNLVGEKTFLVAGAGGLLGTRIVAGLLSHGARVVAVDIDVKLAESRLCELGVDIHGDQLQFSSMDISDEKSVKDLFCGIGEIDGAVNTTYPRNKSYGSHFFDVTLESFNENVSLNLGGSFVFIQQCAAYFNKHKTPFSLVNISSMYGVVTPDFSIYEGTPMTMPVEYAAIKAALLHLSRYAAAYVRDSNFRINSVSPGGILDGQPDAFLDAYGKKTHGAGMLAPEDMIGAVVFLLSDQSRYVVGQNIIVDDGFTI